MARKGYLLATASSVAAVAAAGGAQAADMPLKAPPPAPAPVAAPTWAGWYVGLNAGANWQTSADSFGYAGGSNLAAPTTRTTATGFIGGGQIGYNWQNGSFVYGLEADISGLTGHSSVTSPIGVAASLDGKTFSNQIKWLSTVRGRTGLLIDPTTLAYVTGGLAVGGVKNAFQGQPDFNCCNKSESKTRAGWTVGGGIEHMLWNSHWTVAVEGLFVDLGTSSATAIGLTGTAKTAKFSNQAAIARFKLNYKF